MKVWKERFIQEHCYKKEEGETEYVMKPRSGDVIINFIEQIISERDKEFIEIITQHYIPGHMVVNPTLEAIITKITNTK